jgi:hypothetical protein
MRGRSVFPAVNPQAVVVLQLCSATRELTDEKFNLVGYGRTLLGRLGEPTRDIALMKLVMAGVIDRHCVWTARRIVRQAADSPEY